MKQAEQQAGILVTADLLPLVVYEDLPTSMISKVSYIHHG